MINIKYFLLGAVLTAIPTMIYLFRYDNPKVLSTYVESNTPKTDVYVEIQATPKETATPTPSATPDDSPTPTTSPTKKPTPKPPAATPANQTSTPEPTLTPTPIPTYQQSFNAVELVNKYASTYGVSADILFKIGQCESHFNTNSVSGPYAGIYQFHYSTWQSIRARMNENPDPGLRTNPEESIKTAAYKISKDGTSAWANCD